MKAMRNLDEIMADCIVELQELGVPIAPPAAWSVNTRARRWGQCCYNSATGDFTINIAETLLLEDNDINGLLSTVYHELIHTCPGCFNHGNEWKRWALFVSQHTGIRVERLASAEEKGVKTDWRPQKSHEKRYAVQCTGCGRVYRREKLCEVVRHPENYRCGACHSALRRADELLAAESDKAN